MWDTQNVSFYSFMPSMSTQSIQVQLPCSQDLWEGNNEEEWKAILQGQRQPLAFNAAVKLFVEDENALLIHSFDGVSLLFILHGLMSMFNDLIHFDNRSIYLGDAQNGEADLTLWRNRMMQALETWKMKYDAYAMEAIQTVEDAFARSDTQKENVAFLALYHTAHIIFNADIRHLQIAAGSKAIFGHVVTSADRAESTKLVEQWVRSTPGAAAHATWHAAQMFREGLLNLSKWDINGVFHYPWSLFIGTLACWSLHHFSSTPGRSVCMHTSGNIDAAARSRGLMNAAVSQLASCTGSEVWDVMQRSCPHGLALEISKYLKTIRWTAAFEAMKILEELS